MLAKPIDEDGDLLLFIKRAAPAPEAFGLLIAAPTEELEPYLVAAPQM